MTVSTAGKGSASIQTTQNIARRVTKALLVMWIGLIFIGQWMFAAYILSKFMLPSMTDTLSPEAFSHMIKGHVRGDHMGNAVLLLHLLPVFVLSGFGVLQLVPFIRQRFLRFHRWNGRVFLTLGLMGAVSGVWLTWGRDTRLSDIGALGITFNGLLIPVAIAFAWHYARQRNLDLHMRWALHAFALVNAVWTLRLMLMGWFLLNQGPNGNNATLDGPADLTFSYLCYLLPMAVIEIYWWAKKNNSTAKTWLLTMCLMLMVAITAVGVTGATLLMWIPEIRAAL